jgi:hypothetical protein
MPLTVTAARDERKLYLLVEPAGKYWRFDHRFAGTRETLAIGAYPPPGWLRTNPNGRLTTRKGHLRRHEHRQQCGGERTYARRSPSPKQQGVPHRPANGDTPAREAGPSGKVHKAQPGIRPLVAGRR